MNQDFSQPPLIIDFNQFLQNEGKGAKKIIIIFAIWVGILEPFVALVMFLVGTRLQKAIISMGLGLLILWVILGGMIMLELRDPLRVWMNIHANFPKFIFILFAIGMAMLEEAVTVGMTNTAPLWGLSPNVAYITASPNYWVVISQYSVVVFIPGYIAWAFLLDHYEFHPNWVFILYGLNGWFDESITFGFGQNLYMIAFWVFVYGLMVYLPAYCFQISPSRAKPRVKPGVLGYVLALILPFLLEFPWAGLVIIIKSIL